MAGNSKRGGGDRVLESRHLVGLFLGVVLLCGVFFTLGYVMGRTQYGGPVHAAESPTKVSSASTAATKEKAPDAPSSPDWDFIEKKDNNHLEPAPKVPTPAAVATEG